MTWSRLRLVISLTFIAGCLACIGCTFIAQWENRILQQDVLDLMIGLAEVYSVPIGVMTGAFAANRSSRSEPTSPSTVLAAILLTAIWNLIVLSQFGKLSFGEGVKSGYLESFLSLVMQRWSFLIGATLAYVYGKSSGD